MDNTVSILDSIFAEETELFAHARKMLANAPVVSAPRTVKEEEIDARRAKRQANAIARYGSLGDEDLVTVKF